MSSVTVARLLLFVGKQKDAPHFIARLYEYPGDGLSASLT